MLTYLAHPQEQKLAEVRERQRELQEQEQADMEGSAPVGGAAPIRRFNSLCCSSLLRAAEVAVEALAFDREARCPSATVLSRKSRKGIQRLLFAKRRAGSTMPAPKTSSKKRSR